MIVAESALPAFNSRHQKSPAPCLSFWQNLSVDKAAWKKDANGSNRGQLLLPLRFSLPFSTDRRPSGFCCSDTTTTRCIRPRPSNSGRHAIGRLEYNCSRALNSDWLWRLPICLDSASRVRNCSQCITRYSLYLVVNNRCKMMTFN